jgi:Tfp pilus assembly protein PilF
VPNTLPRLILLALVATTSSRAAEITGTVREVSGDTVTVVVDGNLVPALGDKAEIFFKFSGGDDEVAVAAGSVAGEEAGTVKVKIQEATGEVRKDHLARFTSGNPKPKSVKPSPPTPTESPPVATTETRSTQTSTEAARYFAEGLTKFDANDLKGALAAFTKAIELDPTYAKAYANRANTYDSLRQPERGLPDANEAIRLSPQLSMAYLIRGNCYEDMHQHKRAIEDYDEAIRLDPKNADAYNNRGLVYKRLGQNKSALESYTQAIDADPTRVDALTNRANLYQATGKTELAKRDFARLKELKTKPH